MNNVKIEHCMLAARICAGLLIILFFLSWVTVSISAFGETHSESVNGWNIAFNDDDARFVVITVLLAPLVTLVVTFLKASIPNEKQYYLILLCAAAAGLLFMIISHFSVNSLIADARSYSRMFGGSGMQVGFSAFYVLGFILHIVLACICGFAFWKFGQQGNALSSSPQGAGGSPASAGVKFCPNCGAAPEGATKFCNNCGHDLTS